MRVLTFSLDAGSTRISWTVDADVEVVGAAGINGAGMFSMNPADTFTALSTPSSASVQERFILVPATTFFLVSLRLDKNSVIYFESDNSPAVAQLFFNVIQPQ